MMVVSAPLPALMVVVSACMCIQKVIMCEQMSFSETAKQAFVVLQKGRQR